MRKSIETCFLLFEMLVTPPRAMEIAGGLGRSEAHLQLVSRNINVPVKIIKKDNGVVTGRGIDEDAWVRDKD